MDEGGENYLGLENVLISDLDSPEEVLQVQLHREPHHGTLWLYDLKLKAGHVLTLQDLRGRNVRSVLPFQLVPLKSSDDPPLDNSERSQS